MLFERLEMLFQSLVMIFANLMHNEMEAVLEFLTSVPDPMGKPALEFVLTEWCARQHLFYGAYERKVTYVLLSSVILSLPLIQEGQLSVSGERICLILVNNLEDSVCPVKVWLGKLTVLEMTALS